ncbi:ABC-type maltose transport system permease subunit [Ochrobactrum sp. 19YEA23]|nr:ABC-type maltose transport system permease subunit [Ochrobactrum sp. 19YEA23]
MRQRFGGLFLLRFVLLVYVTVSVGFEDWFFKSYFDVSLALYSA